MRRGSGKGDRACQHRRGNREAGVVARRNRFGATGKEAGGLRGHGNAFLVSSALGMQRTRERIAGKYELVKYYAGNGGNWGADGTGVELTVLAVGRRREKVGNGSVSDHATLPPLANELGSVDRDVHRKWWSGERGQCKPPLPKHTPRVEGFHNRSAVRIWDIGCRKRPSPMTLPMVSDLQCGSFYWHAWC